MRRRLIMLLRDTKLLAVVFALSAVQSCTYYLGPNKLAQHFISDISTYPAVYDYSASATNITYNPQDSIIAQYAAKDIPQKNDVRDRDFVRIVLGKLAQGRDVEQVNARLLDLKPWAGHGSTGIFHKSGDYDFSEITWCTLLYLFGDKPELLYPKTRDHLANVLIENCGNKVDTIMPGTGRLLRETENHIFMGEVSRYLKNQWLHEHGDTSFIYDNARNGIEKWMLNHLDEKFKGGFFEFNSNPYSGYTFQALNTLFSFTQSDTIKHAANKLLNEIMYEYSLSSINLKRYPPFRRRPARASNTAFEQDPVSSIIHVLVNRKTGSAYPVSAKQHGIITLLLHYNLNDGLTNLLLEKNKDYYAKLGHGRKGSPEIYTGGAGYVLSAGGVQRGKLSQLAARPTMLLLNNHIAHADSCFRLCSKGKMPCWNNTGVYYNFACANQAVQIPPQYQPVAEKGGWKVFYDVSAKLSI
ncbi:MAG TPA: hypothetical protein VG603_16430, partial [Chitinophagales bacterium]|nr:hypothetical protein [Chitinophagales bacterium]